MSKIKRTITFILAVIICMTFCCVNSGAVSYRFCCFSEPYIVEYFSGSSAYASVHLSDWAEEENTTDLYAKTYAFLENYDYWENFYELTVYVELAVLLEWSNTYRIRTDFEDTSEGDVELEAEINGNSCLDSENHYGIEYFETEHEVVITLYDPEDDDVNPITYVNDGPIICIGPEY